MQQMFVWLTFNVHIAIHTRTKGTNGLLLKDMKVYFTYLYRNMQISIFVELFCIDRSSEFSKKIILINLIFNNI